MSTSNPSRRAELDDVLNELLRFGEAAPRTVAGATEDVLAIGHGWFMRVIRSLRGVRLLDEAGFAHEAAPLLRTAIEHAVGIRWLATNGDDAVEILRREHKAWAGRVEKAKNDAGGWDRLTPELFEQIANVDVPKVSDDGKTKTKFTTAKQLDLYVAWLSETAMSHPSLPSAKPYMPADDRGRYTLLAIPRPAGAEDVDERCAVAAVVAIYGMASILGSEEWEQRAQVLERWLCDVFAAPSVEAG